MYIYTLFAKSNTGSARDYLKIAIIRTIKTKPKQLPGSVKGDSSLNIGQKNLRNSDFRLQGLS